MKSTAISLELIEWGSLIGAVIFLVISQTYYPSMNLAVGLLAFSWVARRARIGKISRSTPVDVPLLLFILSALIALWAAPSRLAGLVRLYLLLAAISLFYTLVNSDFRSLRIFSTVFVAFVGIFGIFLVSQYDWSQGMARFAPIEASGRWLNRVIPDLSLTLPHWNATRNISASLLSLALPVALVGLIAAVRIFKPSSSADGNTKPNLFPLNVWVPGLGSILIFLGLILIESRTPWMVFSLFFVLLVWWWMSGIVKFRLPLSQGIIFLVGMGLAISLVGFIFMRQSQTVSTIVRIPGPDDYLSRGEIYPQSLRLAQDAPLTGGGLAAFPALYSAYIRVIPHNAFLNEDTGNNAYLNLLVEQGWLGGISFVVILGIALLVAIARYGQVSDEYKPFVIAGVFGLGFILLHGFVHATLVASRAIPALFIPAGLALSGSPINHPDTKSIDRRDSWAFALNIRWPVCRWHLPSAAILATLFAVSLFAIRNSLLSTWYANLGAVHMSRVELADFPSGKWNDGDNVAAFNQAKTLFEQAVRLNPNNRTAHYRLGLIALLERDFSNAVSHLESANWQDPAHRGVRKTLGYSYVWSGNLEEAALILDDIPEAGSEMRVYSGWWRNHGRNDLADLAANAVLHLKSTKSSTNSNQ